jgi:hypothetical protein
MLSRNPAAAVRSGVAAFLFITLASVAFASSIGSSPSLQPQEREAAAQRFVGRALHVWQQRLNLNDWDIRVQLVRPSSLEPRTLGNIHWDTSTKRATIDVLSAFDYTLPLPEMLDDMEFTVVHELVHLDLATLPHSDATSGNEEYAVNQLARALLNLSKR